MYNQSQQGDYGRDIREERGCRPERDCREILLKVQEIAEKGREKHRESDQLTRCVLNEIREQVLKLEKALELADEGNELIGEANDLFVGSGCDDLFNVDSQWCKRILDEARYYYYEEDKKKVAALGLLKDAEEELEYAVEYDEKGDEAARRYIQCILQGTEYDYRCRCCGKCYCCCR